MYGYARDSNMTKKRNGLFLNTLCSIIALILLTTHTNAQFHRLTLEEGLSQSTIFAIVQDKNGFLWVGTQDGLNKYDGYKFTHFKNKSSSPNELSDNNILTLCVDQRGLLWIGTEGGGLNRFDPIRETFTHFRHDPQDPGSISSDYISHIYEDSEGILWIGTEENGIDRFNPRTGTFTNITLRPDTDFGLTTVNPAVRAIVESADGRIWVGTDSGLFLFNSRGKYLEVFSHQSAKPCTLCDNRINVLMRDSLEKLWIGTANGLDIFEPQSKSFIHFDQKPINNQTLSHPHIKAILEDSSGKIWIGTDGGGLDSLDPDSNTLSRYRNSFCDKHSLSGDNIYSLFEDRSGVIWIGTASNGLNKYSNISKPFHRIDATPGHMGLLANNVVWSIYGDSQDYLWIGTERGIRRINIVKKTYRDYSLVDNNLDIISNIIVRSILQDSDGYIWAGTDGLGLHRIDPRTSETTLFRHIDGDPDSLSSDRILILYRDRSDNLWIGTKGGGLNVKKAGQRNFIRFTNNPRQPTSLANNSVYSILQDSRGNIWIGTLAGLDLFDPESETFTHFRHDPKDPNSISDNGIGAIIEDPDGNIWVGTDRGLNLMRHDSGSVTFSRLKQDDGLPNDFVYGILFDKKKRLWISTNRGLSLYDPLMGQFQNFDKADGLPGNEFNAGAYFKDRWGQMFFGGVNGITYFYPHQIKKNTFIPPIVVTMFKKLNQKVKLTPVPDSNQLESLSLSYRDNYISFEFAALDFHAPEKNQYAYMMEGFDNDWHHIGNKRLATYTNLDPGTYTFRVKGSNGDNYWNDEGLAIIVDIVPPFWMTVWFKGLAGLILFLALFFGIRWKFIQMQEQKKKLELIVSERTSLLAETNEELQRIARQDGLTGIANHRTFQEVLEKEWKRAHRERTPLTLIMIDIDFFKVYNDTNGHIAGDRCLSRVAASVEKGVRRPGDLAARYGGDEFSVLLPQTDQNGAKHVAQRIKSMVSLSPIPFHHPAGFERITISLGVATLVPDKTHSATDLVQAADRALYEAKRCGRNRIHYFNESGEEVGANPAN